MSEGGRRRERKVTNCSDPTPFMVYPATALHIAALTMSRLLGGGAAITQYDQCGRITLAGVGGLGIYPTRTSPSPERGNVRTSARQQEGSGGFDAGYRAGVNRGIEHDQVTGMLYGVHAQAITDGSCSSGRSSSPNELTKQMTRANSALNGMLLAKQIAMTQRMIEGVREEESLVEQLQNLQQQLAAVTSEVQQINQLLREMRGQSPGSE